MRGAARGGQGFRAAMGLNVESYRLATSKATELGDHIAAAMENPQETNSDVLSRLGKALATVANRMEPQAADEIAKRGVRRLAAILMKLKGENLKPSSHSPSAALAALVNRMAALAAAEIARDLAVAMENPQETDSGRLFRLGEALAALANKMEPQAAAEIARRLAGAMENPQETDSGRLSRLGEALAALANKMEPQAAAETASRGAQRLVAALENTQETDYFRFSGVVRALAALANKMEPQAAVEIARGLVGAMENPQETNLHRLLPLGEALAALASKMEPQAAAEIARDLAVAMENPQEANSDWLSRLGNALTAVCRLLPSADRTYMPTPTSTAPVRDSTRLLALSNMLLQPVSKEAAKTKEQSQDRKLLTDVCAQLPTEDLVEVLNFLFVRANRSGSCLSN
jgi:hypothetical protein